VLGVDGDLLRLAEPVEVELVELDAEVLHDGGAAGQDRDVVEVLLAPIAVAGRLHGAALQDAAQLVHDQRGERLALDVLRDDQERPARLADLLEQRDQLHDRADLVLVHEDEGVLEHARHLLGLRDEVGREEAAVELHAFDDVDRRLERLALLDGDHAVLADLLHRVGDHLPGVGIVVRRDGADLRDLLAARDLAAHPLQRLDDVLAGLLHAADERRAIRAGGEELEPFLVERLGQDRRRGGAVAGDVVRLRGGFLHELHAEVLVGILELDLLGDGDAVVDDRRPAPTFVEHRAATARPERRLHGSRELRHAGEQPLLRLLVEHHLLRHPSLLQDERREPASGRELPDLPLRSVAARIPGAARGAARRQTECPRRTRAGPR
jgi:hypothetical protein